MLSMMPLLHSCSSGGGTLWVGSDINMNDNRSFSAFGVVLFVIIDSSDLVCKVKSIYI